MAETAKDRRLRRLASISSEVPATFWTLRELSDHAPHHGEQWYVRGHVDLGLPQHPVGHHDAIQLLGDHPGAIVVQEYLLPALSGVAYVAPSAILIETVTGRCAPLLREGRRGSREVYGRSAAGEATARWWRDGTGSLGGRHGDPAQRLLDLLAPFAAGSLVEWILTRNRRMVLVDLRELGPDFLRTPLTDPPDVYESGPERSGHELVLDRTELSAIDRLAGEPIATVTFLDGSPLAHVVVAAVELGWSCRVRASAP